MSPLPTDVAETTASLRNLSTDAKKNEPPPADDFDDDR
jgi:hypothetical protein